MEVLQHFVDFALHPADAAHDRNSGLRPCDALCGRAARHSRGPRPRLTGLVVDCWRAGSKALDRRTVRPRFRAMMTHESRRRHSLDHGPTRSATPGRLNLRTM